MNDDSPIDLRALAPRDADGAFSARVAATAARAADRYARRSTALGQLVRLAPVSLALAAASALLAWRLAQPSEAPPASSAARAALVAPERASARDLWALLDLAGGPR
jgi:hypothetical protein